MHVDQDTVQNLARTKRATTGEQEIVAIPYLWLLAILVVDQPLCDIHSISTPSGSRHGVDLVSLFLSIIDSTEKMDSCLTSFLLSQLSGTIGITGITSPLG